MSSHIRIGLAPIAPDDEGIKIYVSPDEAEDLKADLEASGYDTSWAFEHALGVDDLIIAVAAVGTAVGGLNGLAAVLNAFFHKNQHRSITVKSGDEEATLTGMSKEETKAIIDSYLDRVVDQQAALDESWHRILKETEGDDSP